MDIQKTHKDVSLHAVIQEFCRAAQYSIWLNLFILLREYIQQSFELLNILVCTLLVVVIRLLSIFRDQQISLSQDPKKFGAENRRLVQHDNR